MYESRSRAREAVDGGANRVRRAVAERPVLGPMRDRVAHFARFLSF